MLMMLGIVVVVAALPLIAFLVTPASIRRGAYRFLPWLSGIALAAVALFVVLVNVGVISP